MLGNSAQPYRQSTSIHSGQHHHPQQPSYVMMGQTPHMPGVNMNNTQAYVQGKTSMFKNMTPSADFLLVIS